MPNNNQNNCQNKRTPFCTCNAHDALYVLLSFLSLNACRNGITSSLSPCMSKIGHLTRAMFRFVGHRSETKSDPKALPAFSRA